MGIFEKFNVPAAAKEQNDYVRGQKKSALSSDIYNLIIKKAYAELSRGGAMGIKLEFETPDGAILKVTEYISSGDAKGNKSTYTSKDKDGKTEEKALPGFLIMDSLCQLVLGKSITACDSEKKTINIYDYNKKAEVPTEVDMLIEFLGKPVCACVLQQVQNKNKKNDQTGEYEPTGETYEVNTIDKYLDPVSRKTLSEIQHNLDSTFADQWLTKWKDQIDDQSTEVKNAGLKGAPVASGDAAPKASLFG